MQYKKQFVNDKIIQAGREEYLIRGYKAGNISTIAENAGVPVGNLYRYFDGKPGLLDAIVKTPYQEIPKLIADFFVSRNESDGEKFDLVESLKRLCMTIYDTFGKDVEILIDKCDKSRYDDFNDKIFEQVRFFVTNRFAKDSSDSSKEFCNIITKNYLSAVFDIYRLNLDREQIQELFLRVNKFFFVDVIDRI